MKKIAKRAIPLLLVILMTACLIIPANAEAFRLSQKATCITQPPKTSFTEFYYTAGAQKVGIIPGIYKTNAYNPQGMTYWAAKDWLLIGLQAIKSGDSAVVAIERSTGKFVGEWFWEGSTSHMGGIAATEYNLYITDSNASVACVPLSTLEALGSTGSFTATTVLRLKTYMNTAPISYLGFDMESGIMVLGNYYYGGDSNYKKPARPECSSILLGYDISGCTCSENEIAKLRSIALDPSFIVGFSSSIDRIQGAVYHDGQIIVSRSYGNFYSSFGLGGYISEIDCFNIDLSSPLVSYTLTDIDGVGHDVPAFVTTKDPDQRMKDLPMSEGIVAVGDRLYINYESGARTLLGGASQLCVYATDYVWSVPIAKI